MGAIPATPTPAKIHSFSRTMAEEHGEKAAVLLQYLAHHVSKSKHVHGGRKWFYKTLDALAAVFPYLKRSNQYALVDETRLTDTETSRSKSQAGGGPNPDGSGGSR
jgi:hypothetical protein